MYGRTTELLLSLVLQRQESTHWPKPNLMLEYVRTLVYSKYEDQSRAYN